MTEEFSAGGIVVQNHNGEQRILVSQHSGHHGWVFPKGHVGDTKKGETAEEAAIREVEEETGVIGKIVHKLSPTDYWYQFKGQKRHKVVQYYLMEYESGDIKNHGWEMENVAWLPVTEVAARLTYDSDKNVWEQVKKLLNK